MPRRKAKAPPAIDTRSFADRIEAVLGDEVMSTKQIAERLSDVTDRKLEQRLYSAVRKSTARVKGPNGELLQHPNGGYLKAHRFKTVSLGLYRVATSDDLLQEVATILQDVRQLAPASSFPPAPLRYKKSRVRRKKLIARTLKRLKGDVSRTADALRISRAALRMQMQDFDLDQPPKLTAYRCRECDQWHFASTPGEMTCSGTVKLSQ